MAAVEITWGIVNLERETADGYVFTVHYTVEAFDGTYRSSAYGSIGLERPDGELILRRFDTRNCNWLGQRSFWGGKGRRDRRGF